MENNKVSIIVTTKNSAGTLGECLSSITSQSWKNIELIVVDNSSSDTTKEVAKKYTDKVYNIGPERCTQRNYGASVSTGKYLFFIDSDMRLSADVVKECIEAVTTNRDVAAATVPEESFGTGFWSACKKLERSFYLDVEWMQAARFFLKTDFDKVGGYDESLVSGEDWDLSQRIRKFGQFITIKSFIYHNEGRITLYKTLKKKYYYATKFSSYTAKRENASSVSKQTNPVSRYALFFRDPKKLFSNPLIGLGMLSMKTAEFVAGGIGLVTVKMGTYGKK